MSDRRSSAWGGSILAFLLFLGLSVTLQYLGGAYRSAFSGYPDEPAHYVTGLLVHDWVASRFPWPPLQYASDYYLHYPKVALGHWPPVFYMLQAVWTLLFSTSRVSVLVLMAVLMSLVTLTMFRAIRDEFGTPVALLAGLLLVALPLNQAWTQNLMADVPVALFSFAAALAFGRYLDTGRGRDAVAFGLLASLAILTKGNGLALAFLPPIALAISLRFSLLRRLSLWLPLVIVIVLCGPWYALTARAVTETFTQNLGLGYTNAAGGFYAFRAVRALGLGLLPIGALGLIDRVVLPLRRGAVSGLWAAVTALALSNWLFHTVVAAGFEERYLVPVMPVLVMFLVAGSVRLAEAARYLRLAPSVGLAVLTAGIAFAFAVETFYVPRKAEIGFIQVAADLVARPEFKNSVILVSSEGDGEGMLVSEIAMRERRPGHFVLRATKALARVDWNGRRQEPYYSTPAALLGHLDQLPVGVLVLDLSPGRVVYQHHRLILETLARYPDRFQLVATYSSNPGVLPRGEIRVYRIPGNENPAPGTVILDTKRQITRWRLQRSRLDFRFAF